MAPAPNPAQLLRNAANDALRAAVALEGVRTYEGMQAAEDAIRRAKESLRVALPMVRDAAKPVRAERVQRRRAALRVVPDPLEIPAIVGAGA